MISLFMVLRSYLAVGQKHLKESRVSTLQISKSPVEWDLFPVLLPQFQPKQPRTSAGQRLLPSRICNLRGSLWLHGACFAGADSQKLPCPAFLSLIHGDLESFYCQLCSDPHPQLQFHMEVGTVQRKQISAAVEGGSLPGWEFPARPSFFASRRSWTHSLHWLWESWCLSSTLFFVFSLCAAPSLETKACLYSSVILPFFP